MGDPECAKNKREQGEKAVGIYIPHTIQGKFYVLIFLFSSRLDRLVVVEVSNWPAVRM